MANLPRRMVLTSARQAARSAETHAVGNVVEARFEQLQQPFAGDALGARGLGVGLAELAFEHAIDAARLLLFAQLLAVVREARTAFLAVLARGVAAPLDGAFVGEAFLAFAEKLLALPAALAALGVEISGHAFSLPLSRRAGAWERGSRCAARG